MPSKMTSFVNITDVRIGEKRTKFFSRAIEILGVSF
jgi:hypothetical protein